MRRPRKPHLQTREHKPHNVPCCATPSGRYNTRTEPRLRITVSRKLRRTEKGSSRTSLRHSVDLDLLGAEHELGDHDRVVARQLLGLV